MPDISKPRTAWDKAFEAQEARNNELQDALKDTAKDTVRQVMKAASDLNFDVDGTFERTTKRTGVKVETLFQEHVLELLADFFHIPDPATRADNETGDTRF